MIKKRRLGNSELEVAPLALGGNVFGWTVNDTSTAFKLLDAFVDAGFNLIDTADMYPKWAPGRKGGESETMIGKWLKRKGNRAKALVATKVGVEMSPTQKGLSRHRILGAVEESLQRLQIDTIDLYQSHHDDLETPVEETLEAFDQLVKQGKVRVIGASNFTPERLAQSLETSGLKGFARYESLQPHYNLYDRADYETKSQPIVEKYGLGMLPYYSLASGFLTGKYRSEQDLAKSARGQGIKKYLNDRGTRILAALDEVAKKHESTPASVALAWLMARPTVTAPIASATSLDQLNSLVAAARLELDRASIELLDQASSYSAAASG